MALVYSSVNKFAMHVFNNDIYQDSVNTQLCGQQSAVLPGSRLASDNNRYPPCEAGDGSRGSLGHTLALIQLGQWIMATLGPGSTLL